jgi:hypothetical protein
VSITFLQPRVQHYVLQNVLKVIHFKIVKVHHYIFRIIWSKHVAIKGKPIPVTGREGPLGCEMSRLPYILDNRLTEGNEVVSLTRRPPFTPTGRFLALISVRGSVDPSAIERLELLGLLKNSVTSSGIEPATVRLGA